MLFVQKQRLNRPIQNMILALRVFINSGGLATERNVKIFYDMEHVDRLILFLVVGQECFLGQYPSYEIIIRLLLDT